MLFVVILADSAPLAAHSGWTGYQDREAKLTDAITAFTELR